MKRQSILAGAGIMAAAAFLSRILGWVRDRSIGHYWGSTGHTDAYWAAFGVPDLLYYLLAGGAIGAALIPVFSGYLRRDEAEESWRAANTLITLFLLVAAVGVVCIMIFAPQLVVLVAPGFIKKRGLEASAECAGFVRILAPMVFFTMLSGFFTAILQSHRHFTAPALAWLVYNFGIIGGALVGGEIYTQRYGPVVGLKVVCLGVVIGAVLLVAVQVPSMVARGFRFRPRLDLKHPGAREVIRLFVPYMAGLAFTQICLLWLPNYFGSYFTAGAITSLRYANRLVVLPLGLFGIAISTAAFPAMAERAQAGEMDEFRRLISGSLRAVLFLSVPSAAALIVLAGPILRLLWRSGKFGEGAIGAAEFCLLYYAVALVGLSVLQVVNRAFYSLKDARTPPLVGIGYTAIIVGLAVLSVKMGTRLQYAGIAAATSIGVTIGMLLLFELLRRRLGGVNEGEILRSFLRIAAASVVLAIVALTVSRWSGRFLHVPATHFASGAPLTGGQSAEVAAPISRVAVQVLASMGAGGVAYVLVLLLLRAPEVSTMLGVVRQRVAKRAAVAVAEVE